MYVRTYAAYVAVDALIVGSIYAFVDTTTTLNVSKIGQCGENGMPILQSFLWYMEEAWNVVYFFIDQQYIDLDVVVDLSY